MLRGSQILRSAEQTLRRATPLFVINALIPPLMVWLLPRIIGESIYVLLWPLVAYFLVCTLSIALLLVSRSALSERSLESARRLLLLTGVLGLFTGLVVGGLLALRARSIAMKAIEAKRVKRRTTEGAS
ncbi:MAG: hypothetical protein QW584_02315 [Thermofilaceae archaeon]